MTIAFITTQVAVGCSNEAEQLAKRQLKFNAKTSGGSLGAIAPKGL